jgi:hypothetical protein
VWRAIPRRVPAARNSRARIRTGRSRAASDTTFRRNRLSRTPSSKPEVAGREPLRRAPPSAHGRVARRGSPSLWQRRAADLQSSGPVEFRWCPLRYPVTDPACPQQYLVPVGLPPIMP